MGVTSKVRVFNFLFKLLTEDRTHLLSYNLNNKPAFKYSEKQQSLSISTPDKEGLTNKQIHDFYQELNNRGLNLHASMILKNGKNIAKTVYKPYEEDMWNTTYSLCKTVVGFAVGIAIKEGYFSLEDNVYELILGKTGIFTSNGMKQLTVSHLLTMTSGVNYRETSIVSSSNWSDEFLHSEFNFLPGTQFQYNSMNTYMLAKIIYLKTGYTLMEYLKPRLFEPLGITNIDWELGPEGFEKAGWGMYLRLEDMAKLGQLVLNLGSWNVNGEEKQIISKMWMRDMLFPHTGDDRHQEKYGYQIWVSKDQSYYCFSGLFGQTIYINPEHDLVVAFITGNNNVFNSATTITIIQEFLLEKWELEEDIILADLEQYLSNQRYGNYDLLSRTELKDEVDIDEQATLFEKIKGFFVKKEKVLSIEAPVEVLPKDIQNLQDRKYIFQPNKVGILPVLIQIINGNYAEGLKHIHFATKDDHIILEWEEADNSLIIPIGVYEPIKSTITINDTSFIISAFANTAKDEDDNFVLKTTICFLETSHVRQIKFFFLDTKNEVLIKLDETPSVSYLTNAVFSQISINELPSFLGKDNGYLKFTIDRLTEPEIFGFKEEDAQLD